MSESALQDAQWLEALPQNLDYTFETSFWDQPEAAQAWFNNDEEIEFVKAPDDIEFIDAPAQNKTANRKKALLRLVSTVLCLLFVQNV